MGKKEKFLSMKWFKERAEKAIDKVLEDRLNNVVEHVITGKITPVEAKPYITIKLVNETLTVVLRDGDIVTKPNATEQDYLRVQKASSIEDILAIIEDREVAAEIAETKKEAAKLTQIATGFSSLKKLKDFTVDNKCVYLRGTSRTIPPLLLDKFAAIVGMHDVGQSNEHLQESLNEDDEYVGLKNFFMWCCLNPRAEVADSLYNFLHQNGMKITKQGFFVALRNVVVVNNNGDSDLVEFISNAYNKVKAVWKKNPAEYCVIESDDCFQIKQFYKDKDFVGKNLGNLTQLYLDLPNMTQNRFTDNWTKTFDIRIGQVVSMPKEKADWSTQDCARAGLHFAGHTAPYVLCGDTTVFTLHNPMKVVGIGREKGRCWEYLPFMTTNVAEANTIMNSNDFDFLQLDEEYALRELEGLVEKVKEGFTAEASKYQFNLPSISTTEINSIVLSLGEMKNKITKRVNIID
jgi:hypothetical protein